MKKNETNLEIMARNDIYFAARLRIYLANQLSVTNQV